MRTVFVNPSASMNPRRKRRKSRRRPARKARRVARPAMARRRNVRRRSRRRNAGIAPFVQNPMIMANPRRHGKRRKSRRNPSFKPMDMLKSGAMVVAGSSIGAGANIIGVRRIDNPWVRHGVRIAGAMAAAVLMPNLFGGSMAGSLLTPSYTELALSLGILGSATGTEADLTEISADLEDALDELDDDEDEDDSDLF